MMDQTRSIVTLTAAIVVAGTVIAFVILLSTKPDSGTPEDGGAVANGDVGSQQQVAHSNHELIPVNRFEDDGATADQDTHRPRAPSQRDELRFIRTRKRLAKDVAELLGEDPNNVANRLLDASVVAEVRRALERAEDTIAAAHRNVFAEAHEIKKARLAAGRFETVSLLGRESDAPICEGRRGYRVPRPSPAFPEQYVVYDTFMPEGGEPIQRVFRINPGASPEFDRLNDRRMKTISESKSRFRSAFLSIVRRAEEHR